MVPLALAACSGGGPAGGQALFGVTVLDGRGSPPAVNRVVLIRNGRIADIAPVDGYELPRGAQRVSLPGRFVMPGLIDLDARVAVVPADGEGRPAESMDEAQSAQVLRTLLAFGVTTVRGSSAAAPAGHDLAALAERVRAGELLGPRIVTSGDPPLRLGAVFGTGAQGSLSEWLTWLETIDLEGPQIQETIERLAEAGTAVAPGLLAIHTQSWGDDPRHRAHPELHLAPAASREAWQRSTAVDDWTAEDFERARAAWPRVLELTRRLHEGGVPLAAGSGFPAPWVIPGIGLHDELRLLREVGIPPLEVLRIATYNGALALGLEDELGSIEVGKAADLIVLAADPTVLPTSTRAITHVFLGGSYLEPSALLANLDSSRR